LLIRPNTASNVISGNIVRGSGSVGVILEGSHQTLTGNTVTSSAKEAIRDTGDHNRVSDNVVTPRPGAANRKKP
jgi:parallel beta-helix repeat protein